MNKKLRIQLQQEQRAKNWIKCTAMNLSEDMTSEKFSHFPNSQNKPKMRPGICTKIKYQSEEGAKRALHRQQRWNARVKKVYICPECRFWHLTSQQGESTKWK